jgi:hypothetical protein
VFSFDEHEPVPHFLRQLEHVAQIESVAHGTSDRTRASFRGTPLKETTHSVPVPSSI